MKPTPELVIPQVLADRYGSGEGGLLEQVCPLVTNKMLKVISNSDYGHDAKEHYEAIKAIRDGQNWDKPLTWVPNEVLSLYRWSTFESQKEIKSESEYHITRLFACCAMGRIGDKNENYLQTSPDLLEPMVDSAIFLKGEFLEKLKLEIIAVLRESKPWDNHAMFWIFGLLALSVLGEGKAIENEPQIIGDWLNEVNEESLEWFSSYTGKDPKTFLDINFETIHPDRWAKLAKRMIAKGVLEGNALAYIQAVSEHRPWRNYKATSHLLSPGWRLFAFMDAFKKAMNLTRSVKRQAKQQNKD
ncbi:MAG: hypothetical protein KF824_02275 [Fimbriimonadaceae bacterium]|nr:MAG: hypothetical protein KF824_02275 [Fimbriimonadaceae bacterium]